MTYEAVVARVTNVRDHPNADRLKLATVLGQQVVVGLETVEDTLGIMFMPDGQLSEQYCEANDLIGYSDPDTHEHRGGFFDKNRRVRSQRLRGQRSEGYWTTIDSLAFTGADLTKLKEGTKFSEINNVPICNKYYTPATIRAMKSGKARRKNNYFHKHVDTAQLRYEVQTLPVDSVIYITEKVHGTSMRLGRVLEEIQPNKRQKFFAHLSSFGKRKVKPKLEYKFLVGTRNMVLADHKTGGFYGNEEFRWNIASKFENNLHKGETIYGEVVGYTTTGAALMASPSTDELKDIKKTYGPKMVFKYGQPEGTCEFYIYRITMTNEDNIVTELSWPQTVERCATLGAKTVPILDSPRVLTEDIRENLLSYVDDFLEGPSILDHGHIKEGICLRVENSDTKFYKSKSFTFGVLEGYLKSSDEYVDTEEIS